MKDMIQKLDKDKNERFIPKSFDVLLKYINETSQRNIMTAKLR
jgi:hypothetical protein